MTEAELRDWIFRAAGTRSRGPQPPYVETVLEAHPDVPVDYEQVRARQYVDLLGEPKRLFRPALGAPHVGVYEFAPGSERSHWTYITSGMSDFPQVRGNGSKTRTELVAVTRTENPLAVDLLHSLSLLPFAEASAIGAPSALAFSRPRLLGFAHVALLEPRASGLPTEIALGEETVNLLFVTALSSEEFGQTTPGTFPSRLAGVLAGTDAMLLDGRFGLEAPTPDTHSAAAPDVAGLGCLAEATASPCPQCGGELREVDSAGPTEPILVCSSCGWAAMATAVEYTKPYRWAAERFRQAFGAEAVEIDALPDGTAVSLRVSLPDERPAIVEIRNAEYDLNGEKDPEAALAKKLSRVRDYFNGANRATAR